MSSGETVVYQVTITYNANGTRFFHDYETQMWGWSVTPLNITGAAW